MTADSCDPRRRPGAMAERLLGHKISAGIARFPLFWDQALCEGIPRLDCCNLADLETKMTKTTSFVALCTLSLLAGSSSFFAYAQQNPAPRQPMSFFVTSVGMGHGANLGGVAGADAHCQQLATAVGAGGKTWHAYLSTQARGGQPAVNARDRIGAGPWYNAKGEMIARD